MTCQECGDETDELVVVRVGRRRLKLCEDCAEEVREQQEVAEAAEEAVRGMMEYKGR